MRIIIGLLTERLAEIGVQSRAVVCVLSFRQVGYLVEQADLANEQPGLGVLVILTAGVGDAHVALKPHLLFVLRKRSHIERPPGQAAREIRDLERYLAADLGTNEPAAKLPQPRLSPCAAGSRDSDVGSIRVLAHIS